VHIALRFRHDTTRQCSKFNPADFPRLKKVSLCYVSEYVGCDNESALMQTPFGSAVFKTVDTFSYKARCFCMNLDIIPWHTVFPSLTTFRYYDSANYNDVQYIGSRLTKIQHLAFHYGSGCPNIFKLCNSETNTEDVMWPFHGLRGNAKRDN